MLSLDFVAKRYGKLPSEVMAQGTTFDLYVSDLAMRYQNYLYEKEHGKKNNTPTNDNTFGYSQDQLKAMIKKVKKNADKS